MMNVLQLLDPGSVVGTAILGAVWQALFVVVLAAVVARAGLRNRADARHALWLGALFCVLLSPVTAAILGRSGLVIWRVALPVPQPMAAAAVFEDQERRGIGGRFGDRSISGGISRDVIADEAGLIRDTRAERPSDQRHRAVVEGGALQAKPRGNVLAGGLILLWATGVLVGFIRIGWGWWQLRALSRAARPLEIARQGASLEWVRSALRVPSLPPIEISAAARARSGRPVSAQDCAARWNGRVDFGKCASGRDRARVRPRLSPRRVGWIVTTRRERPVLAPPVYSLSQWPAHAGLRGGL